MISSFISSSVCIFDIIDRYNIQSEDFVSRCSKWISNAIDDIGYIVNLESFSYETKFDNGRCLLPEFCKGVDLVIINGVKADYNENFTLRDDYVPLNRGVETILNLNNGIVNSLDIEVDENDFNKVPGPYYKIANGWFHSNVKSGYAEIIYKQYPVEFNEILGLSFPIIPDEYNTKEAIMYYILQILLFLVSQIY